MTVSGPMLMPKEEIIVIEKDRIKAFMAIKTVYWQIKDQIPGGFIVEFWTKPDKLNMLTAKFVILDEDKLRAKVEDLTGIKRFILEQVKI